MKTWSPPIPIGTVKDASLNEKSGLIFGNHLFTMEDGGNPSGIYAIDHLTGKVLGSFPLQYANRDTEDIALFYPRSPNGPQRIALFVNRSRSIVVVDEPVLNKTYEPNQKIYTVTSGWPAKGCEAAFFDPRSGNCFLFEKYAQGTGDRTRALIKIPAVEFRNPTNNVTGAIVAQLTFPAPIDTNPQPSAADITRDGRMILVCTQAGICVYDRSSGEGIANALQTKPAFLPPPSGGCGEAACFSPDGKSIYHVGERPDKILYRRDAS